MLTQELPWGLTLHFSGVEAKGLLPYEDESSIKRHFRLLARLHLHMSARAYIYVHTQA